MPKPSTLNSTQLPRQKDNWQRIPKPFTLDSAAVCGPHCGTIANLQLTGPQISLRLASEVQWQILAWPLHREGRDGDGQTEEIENDDQ